jgi:hypothetical protein
MILYILLSFTVGLQGGMFELKGEDIVSSSYGPSFGFFGELSVTPNLSYVLSFTRGKAEASSSSVTLDTLMEEISEVVGEDYQYFKGNLSVNWSPLRYAISPYLSGRLGLSQWKLLGNDGNVVEILNGNNFEGLSLSLGGGIGLKGKVAGFELSVEGFSDFIFSENKDWYEGFGGYDDNEWIVEAVFKLGREF